MKFKTLLWILLIFIATTCPAFAESVRVGGDWWSDIYVDSDGIEKDGNVIRFAQTIERPFSSDYDRVTNEYYWIEATIMPPRQYRILEAHYYNSGQQELNLGLRNDKKFSRVDPGSLTDKEIDIALKLYEKNEQAKWAYEHSTGELKFDGIYLKHDWRGPKEYGYAALEFKPDGTCSLSLMYFPQDADAITQYNKMLTSNRKPQTATGTYIFSGNNLEFTVSPDWVPWKIFYKGKVIDNSLVLDAHGGGNVAHEEYFFYQVLSHPANR